MATNFIDKATELRDVAWREVQTSPSFLAFKALDDAVAAMGGKSLIASVAPRDDGPRPSVDTFARANRNRAVKKLSQTEVAEAVLQENGRPLPIGRLMEAATAKGATIGGRNPLANFRSALSKDDRFYSLMRNGLYFWWLDGVDLPADWQEAPDLLSKEGSDASSVHSNQEGGEAYATAT